MTSYLAIAVIFGALGAFMHLVHRWWYARLTALAHANRRSVATWLYPIVVIVMGSAFVTAVFLAYRFFHVSDIFIVAAVLLASVPNLIWWSRRVRSLKALGYWAPE